MKTKTEPYKLWLDDMRPVPFGQWTRAKSLKEFKSVITSRGIPSMVSFDHDLAPKHYAGDYSDADTGLDAVTWLICRCKELNSEFPSWNVHTLNKARGVQMEALLEDV